MKNLSVQSAKELKALISVFNKEADETKKELISKEIIAKFGADNFADASKEIKKVAPKKKKVDAPAIENLDMLSKLNAIGITEKLKSNGAKSIFKKEFNNKADRTKCRNAFQNAIGLFLMHVAKGKKDLADAELLKAHTIAKKFYSAEDAFINVDAYCTNNMDAQKKELIKMFIDYNAPKEIKKNAPKKVSAKKKVDAPKESETVSA